jgi:hypothetical protein
MKTFRALLLICAAVSFIGGCLGYTQQFILSALALIAALALMPEQKRNTLKRFY